ncbi:hypothetical protein ACJX0J_040596 [Zea mays]
MSSDLSLTLKIVANVITFCCHILENPMSNFQLAASLVMEGQTEHTFAFLISRVLPWLENYNITQHTLVTITIQQFEYCFMNFGKVLVKNNLPKQGSIHITFRKYYQIPKDSHLSWLLAPSMTDKNMLNQGKGSKKAQNSPRTQLTGTQDS